MITTFVLCAIAFRIGWIVGTIYPLLPRDRDPDWRRSFTHENINKPTTPPPLKLKRSGGYQPLTHSGKTNPPPSNP
jgi:hypothetical protein